MSEWNDALAAAAKLLADGYTWVRRPLDPKTMSQKIDIYPGHTKPEGARIDWVQCAADDEGHDVAAILSLRRED